jgi:predicted nucleic acid-binding protein
LRLILDTSLLISLRRGDPEAQLALKGRRDKADEVGISRLTEYELLLGANFLWKKYGEAGESAWLGEALDWLTIYEIDEDVIRSAADAQAEALAMGKPLPEMDLLVALSAKSGSELLTLDEDQLKMKELLKSKGVTVEAP